MLKNICIILLVTVLCSLGYVQADNNVAQTWARENSRIVQSTLGFMPTMVARGIFIVHQCMFDAMAPYTRNNTGSADLGIARRPAAQRTAANRRKAISFAAYRCIKHLHQDHPDLLADTDALFASLGYDANDVATNLNTPSGIGNFVAQQIMAARDHDGSNFLGTEPGTPIGAGRYSDYTNYVPANPPQPHPATTDCNALTSLNAWQPLRVPTPDAQSIVQQFSTPQSGRMTPFALVSPTLVLPPGPALYGTNSQDQFFNQTAEVLEISGSLDDRKKVISAYWAEAQGTPPAHWDDLVITTSIDRNLNLRETVQLLFVVSAGIFDASIATWHAKRYYDSVRPITALQCVFGGQTVTAWRGPYQGVGTIAGENWRPYQIPTFLTPPFGEYPSGHSSFSGAAGEVLKRFFNSDAWGLSVTIPAGSSTFEGRITSGNPGHIPGVTDVPNSGPGTVGYVPATDITLTWNTFSDAVTESGHSRLLGGIHFRYGNLHSQEMGRTVGGIAWDRYYELTHAADCDQTGEDD